VLGKQLGCDIRGKESDPQDWSGKKGIARQGAVGAMIERDLRNGEDKEKYILHIQLKGTSSE